MWGLWVCITGTCSSFCLSLLPGHRARGGVFHLLHAATVCFCLVTASGPSKVSDTTWQNKSFLPIGCLSEAFLLSPKGDAGSVSSAFQSLLFYFSRFGIVFLSLWFITWTRWGKYFLPLSPLLFWILIRNKRHFSKQSFSTKKIISSCNTCILFSGGCTPTPTTFTHSVSVSGSPFCLSQEWNGWGIMMSEGFAREGSSWWSPRQLLRLSLLHFRAYFSNIFSLMQDENWFCILV